VDADISGALERQEAYEGFVMRQLLRVETSMDTVNDGDAEH
jgi:hypothetical protein